MMKTRMLWLGCLFALLLACLSLLQTLSEDRRLWAAIAHPDGEGQILLYQRARDRHQTPEILVYSQRRAGRAAQYIGRIALPEDDRTAITHHHRWMDEGSMRLSLSCAPCMIEQRHYDIHLGHRPRIVAQ